MLGNERWMQCGNKMKNTPQLPSVRCSSEVAFSDRSNQMLYKKQCVGEPNRAVLLDTNRNITFHRKQVYYITLLQISQAKKISHGGQP